MKRRTRTIAIAEPGRWLAPAGLGLKARTVVLQTGRRMDWHSTGNREELIIGLSGRGEVIVRVASKRNRRMSLTRHKAVFLPSNTWHTVSNPSPARMVYFYVTGG